MFFFINWYFILGSPYKYSIFLYVSAYDCAISYPKWLDSDFGRLIWNWVMKRMVYKFNKYVFICLFILT